MVPSGGEKREGNSTHLVGRVERGQARGRKLGFPTANLKVADPESHNLQRGVYVGRATWRGEVFGAVVNIGTRPTFGEGELTVELHLLDFSGDLYDRKLKVEIFEKLREERKFANAGELVEQIEKDIARARVALKRISST